MHDARRHSSRPQPERPSQQQIEERRLPLLALDDVNPLFFDQAFREVGGMPCEPLLREVGSLEAIEFLP